MNTLTISRARRLLLLAAASLLSLTSEALVYFLLLSLMLGGSPLALEANSSTAHDSSQTDAEELWEKVIAAKGGRDRLRAVESLLISHRRSAWWGLKWGRVRYDRLYVFPNKFWRWSDERPYPMGISVRTYNANLDIEWVQGEEEALPKKYGPPSPFDGKRLLTKIPIIYLLETKWVKPTLVSVRIEGKGSKQVHVLRGVAEPYEIDFRIDAKTFLPKEIILYVEDRVPMPYKIHSYIEVDGIMMPRAISGFTWRGKNRPTYRFNVEYDPGIFERPPSVEAGPDAWRVKR